MTRVRHDDEEAIRALIEGSLLAVASERPRMRIRNTQEPTVVGRLAIHMDRGLATALRDGSRLAVDVEYANAHDSDGEGRKMLFADRGLQKAARALGRNVYPTDDPENPRAISPIPDLIVHRRHTHSRNVLVLEAKFGSAGTKEIDFARAKLRAFQRPPYSYWHAALLVLERDWSTFASSRIEFQPPPAS